MLEGIVMDVVLQSHQEIARSRTICPRCHTRYGSRVLRSAESLNTASGSCYLAVAQVSIVYCDS